MRKRNVQILFRLTEEEAEHLNELVRKSGRTKEAFLREMVKGYQLCQKPALQLLLPALFLALLKHEAAKTCLLSILAG